MIAIFLCAKPFHPTGGTGLTLALNRGIVLSMVTEPTDEGHESIYGSEKTPQQEAAWKKLGNTCDSKLSEFASDIKHVSLRTETGKGYDVQRLILKDPQPQQGEGCSFFVIEKILPTQDLPNAEFVNSIHVTRVTPMGKFHSIEGYRYDKDGVFRRIVGDTIVPETVKQLRANIAYTKVILSTQTGAGQADVVTERIARSMPSSELKNFQFTGRLSDEEADRLTQEEDDEWFEAQREHFAKMENPAPIISDEPWRKKVQDLAIEIAAREGRAPEEADFNTARLLLRDEIPKEETDQLLRDLKAIEEGRSSRNS